MGMPQHAVLCFRLPNIALQEDLEDSQNIVSASSHKHIKILRADVAQLHKDIAALQSEVACFIQLGDIKQFDDRCIAAARLQRLLGECAALACA
jgi:hypothetical protein